MTHSRTFRVLFVGTLVAAMLAILVMTGLGLKRQRQHNAVRDLVHDVRHQTLITERETLRGMWWADSTFDFRFDAVLRFRAGKIASGVLIEMLKDDEKQVRWNAAYALGELGNDAESAWPFLVDAQISDEAGLRAIARLSLKKINPDAAARAGVK